MSDITGEKLAQKTRGKIYTPKHIVKHILNLSSYCDENILNKHVIDNSCGDGAFLVEIVDRYINVALGANKPPDEIRSDLSIYIHGIEIDDCEHKKAVKNVSEVAKKYGILNVDWDIICGNTLEINKYDGKMSFVLGNPPYVRVHNLGESFEKVKSYNFAQNGMTDLFIVFYEIGLKMLNKTGILGYITPSSLYNSLAGKGMREYYVKNNIIQKVVDLKHNQVFNATTYTTIMILSYNNPSTEIEYYEYDLKTDGLIFVDNLSVNDFYIGDNFYFSSKENLNYLKSILNNSKKNNSIEVKNGFATLKDDFFIGNFDFSEFLIPVIKASTGEQKSCIFPYENNILAPYEKICKNRKLKEHFEKYKDTLAKRSLDKKTQWYAFGRSQGIKDVYKNKFAIGSLLKNVKSIKLFPCKSGVGVYGGLYILSDFSEEKMKKLLLNEKFVNYIMLLGKYKNGGYYTFSSSDLKKFLDFETKNEDRNNEQLGLFVNA